MHKTIQRYFEFRAFGIRPCSAWNLACCHTLADGMLLRLRGC